MNFKKREREEMTSQTTKTVKDPSKVNRLPEFNGEVIEEVILPAIQRADLPTDSLLLIHRLPICGMLIGVALEFVGLENPTIAEFKIALEEYLQSVGTSVAA